MNKLFFFQLRLTLFTNKDNFLFSNKKNRFSICRVAMRIPIPISNKIINFACIVENNNYKEMYVNCAFCPERIGIRIAFPRKGNGRVRR